MAARARNALPPPFVACRPAARGEGLARRMYERFQELVSERDAYRLKAITAPENTGSRAFHEAVGFAVEEVEETEIPDDDDTDLEDDAEVEVEIEVDIDPEDGKVLA